MKRSDALEAYREATDTTVGRLYTEIEAIGSRLRRPQEQATLRRDLIETARRGFVGNYPELLTTEDIVGKIFQPTTFDGKKVRILLKGAATSVFDVLHETGKKHRAKKGVGNLLDAKGNLHAVNEALNDGYRMYSSGDLERMLVSSSPIRISYLNTEYGDSDLVASLLIKVPGDESNRSILALVGRMPSEEEKQAGRVNLGSYNGWHPIGYYEGRDFRGYDLSHCLFKIIEE